MATLLKIPKVSDIEDGYLYITSGAGYVYIPISEDECVDILDGSSMPIENVVRYTSLTKVSLVEYFKATRKLWGDMRDGEPSKYNFLEYSP